MSKGRSENKGSKKYMTEKRRIKNKQKKLDKMIEHLEQERKDPKGNNLINPNTKQEPKRKDLNNLIKSSKIGRKKEGTK
jgi:hypothetical protein